MDSMIVGYDSVGQRSVLYAVRKYACSEISESPVILRESSRIGNCSGDISETFPLTINVFEGGMAKNNMPTDSRDPWRLSLTMSSPEKSRRPAVSCAGAFISNRRSSEAHQRTLGSAVSLR